MARGWESKSVEDQIGQKEADADNAKKKRPQTPAEIERSTKRQGLLLARTRTVNALEATRDERYRQMLQRTLADLDSQLEKLG